VFISNNMIGPQGPGLNNVSLRVAPLGAPGCDNCAGNSTCAPFCGRPNNYYLIQDNEFYVQMGHAVSDGSPGSNNYNPTNLGGSDHIHERNFFTANPAGFRGTPQTMTAIFAGGSGPTNRFVVRNNILDETNWTWTSGLAQGHAGMSAHNNTCYRADATGTGIAVCITGALSECYNNVLYAPNWSGTRRWGDPGGSSSGCTVASNNFDDGMTGNVRGNPFGSAGPSDPADFAPGDGSALIDAGRDIPGVFDDHSLRCRTGTLDVGAIERGASAPCPHGGGSTEPLGRPGKPILNP
jgi:hypothetical protein